MCIWYDIKLTSGASGFDFDKSLLNICPFRWFSQLILPDICTIILYGVIFFCCFIELFNCAIVGRDPLFKSMGANQSESIFCFLVGFTSCFFFRLLWFVNRIVFKSDANCESMGKRLALGRLLFQYVMRWLAMTPYGVV